MSQIPGDWQQPVEQEYAPPTRWPLVIGILSIVLASLGIVCTPVSVVMNQFNPQSQRMMAGMPPWFGTYQIVSGVVGVCVAILLLVAGIQTLRRQPSGRTLHITYGALAMLLAIVGLTLSVMIFTQAHVEPPVRQFSLAIMPCTAVMVFAYPVFLLVWFLRPKIAKEVAGWRGTHVADLPQN